MPLPKNFFIFLSGSGAFWCILGACYNVSVRRVKVKTVEKQFCVLIGQLCHMANVTSVISYIQTHLSEQLDTHAAYTMDIVGLDIHVHAIATIYLYLLLLHILFQEIQLHFTIVTFC